MTQDHTNTPPTSPVNPQDNIKALCGWLAQSMGGDPNSQGALQEQIQVMNALFHATLAAQLDLNRGYHSTELHNQNWIRLALQIQRQCMDTVRAEKAVDYMDSLTAMNISRSLALPHPPQSTERNDEV